MSTSAQAVSPRKSFAFRVSAILVVILLTFVMMEIVARLYIGVTGKDIEAMRPIANVNQRGRMESHPFLPMALAPNTQFELYLNYDFLSEPLRWSYSVNDAGFRGEAVSQEKADNVFRVIALGGSATFGEGANDEEAWPAQLQQMLQEQHPDLKVEVLNFGIPTATSAHSLVLLGLRGVYYRPDAVIFYEGVNDISCCLGYENFRTDYSHRLTDYKGLSPLLIRLPDVFYQSYAITIANRNRNRAVGNDTGFVDAIAQPPSDDPLNGIEAVLTNILSMKALTEANGGEFILSTYHWFEAGDTEQAYDEALRQLADERDLHLVDQAALIPNNDVSVHIDPVHFTALGNEMMARNYFEYLEVNHLVP